MHRYHYLPDARPAEAKVVAWKVRQTMPDQLGYLDFSRDAGGGGYFGHTPEDDGMGGAQRQPKPTANLERGKPTPFVPNEDERELFDMCDKAAAWDAMQSVPPRVPVIVPVTHPDCRRPFWQMIAAMLVCLLAWQMKKRK